MKSFSSFSFFFFKFNTVSLFLRGSGLAQLAQASLLLAWEIFPSEFAAPGREVFSVEGNSPRDLEHELAGERCTLPLLHSQVG